MLRVQFSRGVLLLASILFGGGVAQGAGLPDEYETSGGHGIGLGHSAIMANTGIASVVLNPALIALEKDYHLSVGFSWPRAGREFYQAGVVDGKTSRVAAGVLYTGFYQKFDAQKFLYEELDSPLKRRVVLAVAGMIGKVAVGVSGQYLEGYQFQSAVHGLYGLTSSTHNYAAIDYAERRGVTAGLGVGVTIIPALRVGASVSNLANRKVKDFAPRTMRAGLAYVLSQEGQFTAHLDYRERQRVALFEGENTRTERLAIASCSVLVYDMVRLLGAYGRSMRDKYHEIAAGATLVSDKVSFSYGFKKPLDEVGIQHSVSLGLAVAI